MIEINLLPWRSDARKKRKKNEKNVLLVSVLLVALTFSIVRFWYIERKIPKQVEHSVTQVKKISHQQNLKWAGYLHDDKQFIGLVMLQNGVTMDVKVGSVIDNNKRVIDIDERGIVMMHNGKKERVGDAI